MKRSIITLLTPSLMTFFGAPALAQDAPVMDWSYVADAGVNKSIMSDMLSQQRRQRPEMPRGGNSKFQAIGPAQRGGIRPIDSVAFSALKFAPSLARRRENYAQFVAKQRLINKDSAGQLEQVFSRGDVVESMVPGLKKYGLGVDNVADAYAIWWVQAWMAAHSDAGNSNRDTFQAVKAQAARAILSANEYRSATDAAKQEFAEALLVQAAILGASAEQVKNDPARFRQLGAAIRSQAKGSGIDLDAMTLTERGFVPSGKTGEADPAPGEAPKALAAVDSAPGTPAPASQPPYILIAAAGGAGLGGVFLLGKMMGKKA